MIFTVEGEKARWIQKTLSRLRCKDDWSSLASREACWTPAFLSALIDEVDYLLTSSLGQKAYDISRHLQVMAERIRAEDCPQGELDKRSLVAWAMAVHASSCRATNQFEISQAHFRAAFQKANQGVSPWAMADLDRRYAVYLLQRREWTTFEWIARALPAFEEHPERLAETLILRGAAHTYISRDNSAALADFGRAASLVVSLRTERARHSLFAAFHNMARQLVADSSLSLDSLSRARKLIQISRRHFGQGINRNKLTSIWIEGILVYRMGWNRHGERLLERAREGFRKLELNEEYVMSSIDLALFLRDDGEPEKAQEVLAAASCRVAARSEAAPFGCASWQPTLDKHGLLELRNLVEDDLRSAWRERRQAQPSGRAQSQNSAIEP